MAVHPRTGKSPEALVKILITVIEKTPYGGATMDELKVAYCDVKDTLPSDKTIYRNIHRVNKLFNPTAFTLKDVFGAAWGIMILDDDRKAKVETVRLCVKKGVAERFKAMQFHDSQLTKPLSDDEAEVSFEVAGADEMIPWLVSWGGAVEVLEPQWLKDQLLAYVEDIVSVYR